ncbi:hypothetical protein BC936DRAFT_141392 [Jimgerdemannia flammicorona]|uniref:AAA domain-containing protein n=1 Tax=Jimgerdemannia flammicorona TaxID=994334 RepID=A0A433DMK1_9FUNG|nr:hypothetical protein BC936DRAFT_141392 [Jimgerdemannia flammicorona]
MSFRIFGKNLPFDELTDKLDKLTRPLYILVDEFQGIFSSPEFHDAAKNFFKNLSFRREVSYVGVGSFKLLELLNSQNSLDSSFNKATFRRMPFFTSAEMGKLFDLYKEQCDPEGLFQYIQGKVMHESRGHPASFMILLKLALQYRPTGVSWPYILKEKLCLYMGGTHIKIKQTLELMNLEDKGHIRDLTKNQMDSWNLDAGQYSILDQNLLNFGILVPDENRVMFTSGIILRLCIDTVWPRPMNRLLKEDIDNPIRLLEHGLQCISPATIVDMLVRSSRGPQENSFQVALYSAFNSLLPPQMKCLIETKAKGQDQLDLMVIEKITGTAIQFEFIQNIWAGYEFEVGLTTQAEFARYIKQALKYSRHYKMKIHLVNFYLDGHSTPAELENVPTDIVVVNVMHNVECTKFVITEPGGKKITVNTNDQNPQ